MVEIAPIVSIDETAVDPEFWLAAAHGAVRRAAGWHVAPKITETLTLDGSGSRALLLPSNHVVNVTRVVNDGIDVTDAVDWSVHGVLEARCGRFTNRLRGVEVTLVHGYELDEVPEVASLIVTLARRGASAPGIIARQSVNGASVDYVTAGGAPISIPLLAAEIDALAPYRLTWGPK